MPELTIDCQKLGIIIDGDVEDYQRVYRARSRNKPMPKDIEVHSIDSIETNSGHGLPDLIRRVEMEGENSPGRRSEDFFNALDTREFAIINNENLELPEV